MAYDESRILVIVHNPSDTEVFYFNGNKSYNASSFYKDRVGIVNVTDDAVAFSLKNVTLADAGSYTCREHSKLTLIPDCGQYLYYLDEDTFPVLPDKCQLVRRYEGQTVSLLCVVEFSSLPGPGQGYTWTFSANGSQATTQLGETGVKLTLSPLSRGHTGSYSCENVDPTYTGNTSGKSSIDLDVTVPPPLSPQTSASPPAGAQSDSDENKRLLIAVLVVVVVVLLLLVIVVLLIRLNCTWCKDLCSRREGDQGQAPADQGGNQNDGGDAPPGAEAPAHDVPPEDPDEGGGAHLAKRRQGRGKKAEEFELQKLE